MIERYTRSAMREAFSEQTKLGFWLAVERAALAALAAERIAPESAFEALEDVTEIDADAVRAREAEIHHDLAAFVDVLGREAPDAASWIHYGLTSSDVVDTGLALQIRTASEVLRTTLRRLRGALLEAAWVYRDQPMLGRTHGMPAEPTTFGTKLAGWWHSIGRDEERLTQAGDSCAVGKLSGAVGTYAQLPANVESRVLTALGLQRDDSATQIVQRDRHAALLGSLAVCAGTLERIALEFRHLQRAEVGELAEPFAATQKGSSAMPHKRNPIIAERICGLARVVRANALVGFENIGLWHERDISHSSAERVVIPDSFALVDYMADKLTWLIEGMEVRGDQMVANLAGQRGLVGSQAALLACTRAGIARDTAYRWVQAAAHDVLNNRAEDLGDALRGVLIDSGADHSVIDDVVESARRGAQPSGVDEAFSRLPARP